MIQRLTDIKTDAIAAFEKESRQLVVRVDSDALLLVLQSKVDGSLDAAEIIRVEKADWQSDEVIHQLKRASKLVGFANLATIIYITATTAMPVPAALIEKAATFLQIQFGRSAGTVVHTNMLNDEIAVAYEVSENLTSILQRLFSTAAIKSSLALLISKTLNLSAAKDTAVLYLHINKTATELVLADSGKLLLAKCFAYRAPEDILYHSLNACQQLGQNPHKIMVAADGVLEKETGIWLLLETYFGNVQVPNEVIGSGHNFRKVYAHFFTGLMENV